MGCSSYPSEAAAGLARSERRVEGEHARHRLPVLDVAARAVQRGREAPRRASPALPVDPVEGEAAAAGLERAFNRLHGAGAAVGAVPGAEAEPVRDDLDAVRVLVLTAA